MPRLISTLGRAQCTTLPRSQRWGLARRHRSRVAACVQQQHRTSIRVSPFAKSFLIPGTAGLTFSLAGNAVANQTGLGEPIALAVGFGLMAGIFSLDVISSMREDERLERERPIFLNLDCQQPIMVTTEAICDACADDLSKLDGFMKQHLSIDSETPLKFKVTTGDGVSRTVDMELQLKWEATVSGFLRSLIAVTVSYEK